MDVILGIDIGGSTTKIVGLRTDGSIVSMLRVQAEDQGVVSFHGLQSLRRDEINDVFQLAYALVRFYVHPVSVEIQQG